MNVFKRAILTSAVMALAVGAILTVGGFAPVGALSYPVQGTVPTVSERLLAISVPTLSPSPQNGAPAATGKGPDSDPTSPQQTETGEEQKNDEATQPPSQPTEETEEETPSASPEGAKPIKTKTYASSLSVNNLSPVEIDVPSLIRHVPDIDLSGEGPQILIVHTHTTESYNENGADYYTGADTRSDDPEKNMIRMGKILDQTLTEAGYRVVHCRKVHDEDFNHSYTESNHSVREYLEKYPSIAVVIDLHRDSLIDDAGTKYRPVVTVNGETAAQIMLLMGVGNSVYPHPNWQENLSLALRIQKESTERYPGLMRPVLVRPSRYNQYLSNGAILVELGSCGNTPEEAERSARLFGNICAAALDQIREEQS